MLKINLTKKKKKTIICRSN